MGLKNFRGFTLIELLVVVAIIGVLAAVGVVAYNGYTNSAKKNIALTNYRNVIKYVNLQKGLCSIDANYLVKLKRPPDCVSETNRSCNDIGNNLEQGVQFLHYNFVCANVQNPYSGVYNDFNVGDAGNISLTVNDRPGWILIGYNQSRKEIIIRMNSQTGGPIFKETIVWE